MQLVRALLKPANGTPRIVFDRRLTVARDELRRPSYTNRGVWFSYSEGLRFEVDQRTKQPREEIRKDGKWDHSYEASAYGAVIVFQPEFQRLYDLETGPRRGRRLAAGGVRGAWRTS
ncbi:MAG: hypothetical protein M5U09_13725 [Gammaproteobacteria bacterium]|nr:hypothetical protein [Gammaproteobacteria bacterium]